MMKKKKRKRKKRKKEEEEEEEEEEVSKTISVCAPNWKCTDKQWDGQNSSNSCNQFMMRNIQMRTYQIVGMWL